MNVQYKVTEDGTNNFIQNVYRTFILTVEVYIRVTDEPNRPKLDCTRKHGYFGSILKLFIFALCLSPVVSIIHERNMPDQLSEYLEGISQTSLSRTRLFRFTAYLEVKIWSLF